MKALEVENAVAFKNILFLTDFSKTANNAAEYAAALAKEYGAKLHAMHVGPPVVSPMMAPASWYDIEEVAAARKEELRKEMEASFPGLKPDLIVEEGDIWTHVTGAIKKHAIDLMVMGTHGRGGARRLLLGSVAEEIFRNAECPVLTVGPHVPEEIRPCAEFTRILFAKDFKKPINKASAFAVGLAQEYQARITFLHVIREPKTGELVQPHDLETACRAMLQNLLPEDAEHWCVPDFVVEEGEPAERILEVAARRKAQLIVMGVHKEQGVPGAATHLPISVVHEVVAKAPCPVLTICE